MQNHELEDCLRKCEKLIRMIEQDINIPSSLFSGETADSLKSWKIMQKSRIEKVLMELEMLR